MFKRAFFVELLLVTLALPGFALPVIAPKSPDNIVKCDETRLGVTHGEVFLRAIWTPNISSVITLDSQIYANKSDSVGITPADSAVPSRLYSKYSVGVYMDANVTQRVTRLATVPQKDGYRFYGFYTEKYSGGVKVIDETGTMLNAVSTVVSEKGGTAILYAHWQPVVPNECPAGTYWSTETEECVICPANHYCGGNTDPIECDSPLQSPPGAKLVGDCGIVLHIGDEKLYLYADKQTSPSLVVEIDGRKWYGNTTPISQGAKPMSGDTTKTLHIKFGGAEYTVHGRYED